jgi:ATP-dependent helicase/nuclease subunit A
MTIRRVKSDIPDFVRGRQIEASDPAVSAFVAANAGSGKTHVLAQRVIRLLLQGCDPAKILCITFTKAAAANMANRVFAELRKWTALDDDALDASIRAMSNEKPSAALRARARRLFALALETPGGLKVQTIHAFCTHLLHLFPFEANVAARFTVLDEAAENQLLEQMTTRVLLDAAGAPDSALGRALSDAIAAAADTTFRDLVRDAMRRRDSITSWIDASGGTDNAIAGLSRALGVDPADTDDKADADLFAQALLTPAEWPLVAAAFAQGSKTDVEQANRFAALAAVNGKNRIETYLDIFCTKDRAKTKDRLASKAIQNGHSDLYRRLLDEQSRVWGWVKRKRAIAARSRTVALITIADAVLSRYRAEKDRRGLLDYEDLIDKAQVLLDNVSSAWVHYKLDRGIDHVLIDEAQDTSPKQWAIVRALTEEFFAGEGARRVHRTIFAVGDEKQSIFSFQGAAPREFAAMHRIFLRLAKAAEHELRYVRFDHSLRSGPNVLAAVDTVFAEREVYRSVTTDESGVPCHIALPNAAPGLVEIWPTEKPGKKREMEAWDAPFDEVSEESPLVRLARRIAKNVRLWQRQGRRPGDVLVLVRRRGMLFEAIIRALKNEGISVAGADRLVLTEHIAIMDLMALADALLLAEDDLALATVLKSPLFGLDDDDLFDLAFERKGSLRDSLRERRPDLAARLDVLGEAARRESPFSFYARLLGAGGGREAFLSRLGHEAADALDEFLNLALDYERSETPSLQGFVAWLRAAKSQIKRDMEVVRDEVRVMTVHGAKGLEAPVVVLADTTAPPQGWHPPRLLLLPPERAPPGTPAALVWAGSKDSDVAPIAEARAAAVAAVIDEYRRLLYVAMTRASDRLIVCGVDGEHGRPAGCWYDLVVDALTPGAAAEPADDGDGQVLRYRKVPDEYRIVETQARDAVPISMPEWLRRPIEAEDARPVSIRPSGYGHGLAAVKSFSQDARRQHALARGTIVHRLMQSLPDIPPERRLEAARRFVARRTEDFSDYERDEIVRQVLAILDDPRFAPLFAPGGRAEVPIIGRLGERLISGVVDRLIVGPEAILIADYKTDRPAPRAAEEAQERFGEYVSQLALYRGVLERLYAGRPVRAALVWTDTPALMEISSAALDAALSAALTSA